MKYYNPDIRSRERIKSGLYGSCTKGMRHAAFWFTVGTSRFVRITRTYTPGKPYSTMIYVSAFRDVELRSRRAFHPSNPFHRAGTYQPTKNKLVDEQWIIFFSFPFFHRLNFYSSKLLARYILHRTRKKRAVWKGNSDDWTISKVFLFSVVRIA